MYGSFHCAVAGVGFGDVCGCAVDAFTALCAAVLFCLTGIAAILIGWGVETARTASFALSGLACLPAIHHWQTGRTRSLVVTMSLLIAATLLRDEVLPILATATIYFAVRFTRGSPLRRRIFYFVLWNVPCLLIALLKATQSGTQEIPGLVGIPGLAWTATLLFPLQGTALALFLLCAVSRLGNRVWAPALFFLGAMLLVCLPGIGSQRFDVAIFPVLLLCTGISLLPKYACSPAAKTILRRLRLTVVLLAIPLGLYSNQRKSIDYADLSTLNLQRNGLFITGPYAELPLPHGRVERFRQRFSRSLGPDALLPGRLHKLLPTVSLFLPHTAWRVPAAPFHPGVYFLGSNPCLVRSLLEDFRARR